MIRKWLLIGAAVWTAATVTASASRAQERSAATAPTMMMAPRQIIERYCTGCHNQRVRSGDLALDTLDVEHVGAAAATWERVVRKLRARAMPPMGAPRPDEGTYAAVIASLEASLDRAAAANPNPGSPLVRRLNRAEYQNAVNDLLALAIDASQLLPADDSAYGFDTVSDVLNVSPVLQERYLVAARRISALAIGDPEVAPGEITYRVRQDLSQNQHVEGLPLGTIGGTVVRHTFPLDGEYVLQTKLMRTNLGMMRGLEYPHTIEY